jgi:hypothetical protein
VLYRWAPGEETIPVSGNCGENLRVCSLMLKTPDPPKVTPSFMTKDYGGRPFEELGRPAQATSRGKDLLPTQMAPGWKGLASRRV